MASNTGLIFRLLRAECDLTTNQKMVLLVLLNHWNPANNGAVVWPGQDRIASQSGLATKSVYRALLSLQDGGYIKIQRRTNHQSNIYQIQTEVIEALIAPVRESDQIQKLQSESPMAPVRESDECLNECPNKNIRHSPDPHQGTYQQQKWAMLGVVASNALMEKRRKS